MATLKHPHLRDTEIEREGEAVERHLAAGWVLVDDEPAHTDPEPHGEEHDDTEENE